MKLYKLGGEYLYFLQFGKDEPASFQTLASTRRLQNQLHKFWLEKDIEDLSLADIAQLKEEMIRRGCKMSTIYKVLCYIRSFLKYASDEKKLKVMDYHMVRLPHIKPPPVKYLTSEQIDKVLSHIDTSTIFGLRLMVFITTMLDTGMRVSECLSLRRDSIQSTKIMIGSKLVKVHFAQIIGKGGFPREVMFKDWPLHWINKYLAARTDKLPNMFVKHCIPHEGGVVTPMQYGSVQKVLTWLTQKSGVDIASHMLRRSGATKMSENGADLSEIQKFLGHRTVQYTMRYVAVSLRRLAEAHRNYNKFGVESKYRVR